MKVRGLGRTVGQYLRLDRVQKNIPKIKYEVVVCHALGNKGGETCVLQESVRKSIIKNMVTSLLLYSINPSSGR